MFEKEIYIVRKGETYNNATVCGYFTDKDKAERYCVLNEDCFIEKAKCLDGLDLPESRIIYEYSVNFCNCSGNWQKYSLNYTPVASTESRDGIDVYSSPKYGDCLSFVICIKRKDPILAEEKARDMLDELLSMSNNNIDELTVHKMNKKLAAEYKEVD